MQFRFSKKSNIISWVQQQQKKIERNNNSNFWTKCCIFVFFKAHRNMENWPKTNIKFFHNSRLYTITLYYNIPTASFRLDILKRVSYSTYSRCYAWNLNFFFYYYFIATAIASDINIISWISKMTWSSLTWKQNVCLCSRFIKSV